MRGMVIGHNFLTPHYGLSDAGTLDFLIPYASERRYHIMSYTLDVNNVPRELIFPHIPQELLITDRDSAPPPHPDAPRLAPTPPVADRVISAPTRPTPPAASAHTSPSDDWSHVSAPSVAASAAAPASSVRILESSASQPPSIAASSMASVSLPPRPAPQALSKASSLSLSSESILPGPLSLLSDKISNAPSTAPFHPRRMHTR